MCFVDTWVSSFEMLSPSLWVCLSFLVMSFDETFFSFNKVYQFYLLQLLLSVSRLKPLPTSLEKTFSNSGLRRAGRGSTFHSGSF